jgi:hypothetical protein
MLCACALWAGTTSLSPANAQSLPETAADDKPAPSLPLKRLEIPGGPRLLLVHAPSARRQTTFTFLPMSLVSDDPGRAQWSHLLEHMLIRSTDAEGLMVEGVTFNGETTQAYLRLETFAEPDEWKNALERHALWLSARAFEPARLSREKRVIEMEEQNTAAAGFTGKFALAAWNQVIAHGRRDVAVHGDVLDATAEQVNAYAAAHMRLDDSVLIASIGPIAIEQVEAEITRLLQAMPENVRGDAAAAPGGPDTSPAAPLPAGTQPELICATWDLPTRHAMFWWPLPDRRPQTLAAATAVARAVHLRFLSDKNRATLARSIQPYPFVVGRGKPCLMFDACLNAGVQPDQVADALQTVIADLTSPASKAGQQTIVFAGRMAANETPLRVDFAALARQMPTQLKDAVEGVWLLGLLNVEYAWGIPAEEALPMLAALDEAAVADVLSRLKMPPQSLALEPKD